MNQNHYNLQQLFSERLFRVPDYQRGFAWGEEQISEFLDDLDLLSHVRRHYTGTIVLYTPSGDRAKRRTTSDGTACAESEIVDGQQRLTTAVLLLAGISRALGRDGRGGELSSGIRRNYIEATDQDEQPLFKLSANRETDDFFRRSVLAKHPGPEAPPTAAAKRLLEARLQIDKYLERAGRNGTDSVEWLRELHRKITTRLHFNLYEVDDAAEVGLIFEVMNDRGLSLSDLEKVKNFILYAASAADVETAARDDFVEHVNHVWGDVLRRLMRSDLGTPEAENQLLRAHWLMRYQPRNQDWKGSKTVRARFDLRSFAGKYDELLRELRLFVDDLADASVCYCDARQPSRNGGFSAFAEKPQEQRDIVEWSAKLNRMNVLATFLPLLLAVRRRWPHDGAKYLTVVQLCERVAFRVYRVATYNSNYRQAAVFRLAFDVSEGKKGFDEVLEEFRTQYNARYGRRVFREFIEHAAPDEWADWRGLRYFLYEYEHHLAKGRGAVPRVRWKETESLEHILPQSIEKRPYWRRRFRGKKHAEYVNDLGNLVLTRHNSSYGNKPFPKKKGSLEAKGRCYARSPLFQEQELAREDDWTPGTIEKRRERMLKWAAERWAVDFDRDPG